MPESDPSLSDEQLLDRAVRQAGEIALKYYNSSAKAWDKNDGSPVTEADIAVDDYLKKTLLQDRPDYGWLSEETTDDLKRMTCKRVWIVDPIDGTSAFVNRTDQWCVSIALLDDGHITLARIFRPLTNEMYSAKAGGGATLNGKAISTTDCQSLDGCRIMGRKGVLKPSRWAHPWPTLNIDCTTSLALRLCLAADGRSDGAISMGKESDWDLAAADLIVHEAGGLMSDIYGNPIKYNQENPKQSDGVVVGGKAIHAQMLNITKSFIN